MQIEKLSAALSGSRKSFDMDDIDIMLLGTIIALRREYGELTIMQLISRFKEISPATAHARIKTLVERKLLIRVDDPSDLRIRKLEPTEKARDWVEYIAGI